MLLNWTSAAGLVTCAPPMHSWRVDETYVKVKGQSKYLYRAVDSVGNTLDLMLRAKRDARAAERFFRKTLSAAHPQTPQVSNVDQNAAYPKPVDDLKADKPFTGNSFE